MSFRYFAPESLPNAYDIVFCYFPYEERPGEPGPIDHPCLVIDAVLDDHGRPHVRLICGTSNQDRRGREYFDIPLEQGRHAGLSKDTKLNFEKFARIPWAVEYFRTPRSAPLPPDTVADFQREAAYYQHEHPAWDPFSV